MLRLVPLLAVLLAVALVAALAQSPAPVGARASLRVAPASGITTVTTDTIVIPTYSYAPALFTSTNTAYNMPYRWLHWGEYDKTGRVKSDKAYTRLTLENDWLRVSLLPELGGRVYEMVFKPTGNNELYWNPVIKPTGWGPPEQGWWLAAGGIEWGLPVEEHGYESAIPWSYAITHSSAGITVTLRDSAAPDRLRASVEVFVPNDRAVLVIRPTIENARGVPLGFKWWANAMLAPGAANTVGPDLRFIFPIDAVTVHSTNDDRLPGHGFPGPGGPTEWITWPMYDGVDWSRLGNFDEWFGFFGRPQAQQDFVGVVDTAMNEGVVRVFPHTVAAGIKGFAMGWLHPIASSQWTDDGSTYAELHGGLAPTFWDSVTLNAGQSLSWEETWYPVSGIGAFTTANAEAALTVEQAGSALNLGLFSTRAREATRLFVYQRSTCSLIAQRDIASIDPAAPQSYSISTSLALSDLAILFTGGNALILGYNPTDCVAPMSAVHALPGASPPSFVVSWSGSDMYSGVASYDIQYKDGRDGSWTGWLTATTQTSGVFTGAHGHTTFFRARARDLAGRVEPFGNDEWGQAFTTVLTTPAAVMETSRKTAPAFFAPGQPVTYTLLLSNTGNLADGIALTDTLPVSMTLITDSLSASSGPAPTFDGARILWSGVVTHNTSVLITYALSPTLSLGFMQPQTNTAVIDGGVVPVARSAVTSMARLVFLPLIFRAVSP